MWESQTEVQCRGSVHRVVLLRDGASVSFAEVVDRWCGDGPFRAFFAELLADAPFEAYFWETPPMTLATAARTFEFVLVDSLALAALPPDPDAFAGHFKAAEAVATFPNLGGDAVLVAPAPLGQPATYTHLAAFTRQAPIGHQHALWQAVGTAVTKRLSAAPLWLSTSGLGIAWLHVRLDQRPKYYTYAPYRSPPG